ncbi:transglycosylase domain-containing protein [Branchiibius cervicis]|uniref:Transglycosylase domain-containing protein n=1 Tax=Branchiibius cervicis TaxID=908252 RepID=A0ABW2ANR5_9MICO
MPRNRLMNVFTLLAAFVLVSLAMGMVVAGLALPALGAAGKATTSSIKMFNDLPGDFQMNPLAQQSRILAADNTVIATPYNENRIVVPLSRIAPIMQKAQIAIEDERFYQHGGVDPRGLLRAVASNQLSSSGVQGASTLTQQYVKVALQDEALSSGDPSAAQQQVTQTGMAGYVRKLQQLKYAISLEQKYTKDQILDGYLNLVYYGDQVYGIEAAAQHYFSVPASQLTVAESALLAGVVNQPGTTDPVNNPKAAIARRNVVLQKMLDQGYITQKQFSDAVNTPIEKMLKVKDISSSCATSKYPYFCDYVTQWLRQQPALGATVKQREGALKSGGLTIKTSFNPKYAAVLDASIKAKVPVGNSAKVDAAGIIIQPGTGLILASGQNTKYSLKPGAGNTTVNYTTPSGGNGGVQIGSTAKAFAVITALENGYKIDSSINLPTYNGKAGNKGTIPVRVFTHSQFSDACGLGRGDPPWLVGNDVYVPPHLMSLSQALGESVNTAFATLGSGVGVCKIADTMTKVGLVQGAGKPLERVPSGIILGSNDVTPLTLANAYATVASGGKYCEPRPVSQILDSNNKAMPLKVSPCKQVMSKDVAAATTKVLQAVFDKNGTAENAGLAGGRPAAGKTGTTDNAVQTWFVGYTPSLVTAIWVGSISTNTHYLTDLRIGDTFYKGTIFGGTLAAPIWKTTMDTILKGQPIQQFPQPSDSMYDDPSHKNDPNWVNTGSIIEGKNMRSYSGYRSTNDGNSSSTNGDGSGND